MRREPDFRDCHSVAVANFHSKMPSIPNDSSDHREVVPIGRVVIELGPVLAIPAYVREDSSSSLSRVGYGKLHV